MRGTSPDPSKGGECQKDKDLQSKLIVYWLILFLNHYPICLSPPLEELGEVLEGRLFVNNFPYAVFQHMVF